MVSNKLKEQTLRHNQLGILTKNDSGHQTHFGATYIVNDVGIISHGVDSKNQKYLSINSSIRSLLVVVEGQKLFLF